MLTNEDKPSLVGFFRAINVTISFAYILLHYSFTFVFPQTEPNSSIPLKCREPIFRKSTQTPMHWNLSMFTPIPQAAPRLYTDRDFSV